MKYSYGGRTLYRVTTDPLEPEIRCGNLNDSYDSDNPDGFYDLDDEELLELAEQLRDLDEEQFRDLLIELCGDPVELDQWLTALSPDFMPVLGSVVGPIAKALIAKEVITTLAKECEARAEVPGRAAALLELLADKFGPAAADSAEDTIRAADLDRLTAWNKRVLTADSVAAVLV